MLGVLSPLRSRGSKPLSVDSGAEKLELRLMSVFPQQASKGEKSDMLKEIILLLREKSDEASKKFEEEKTTLENVIKTEREENKQLKEALQEERSHLSRERNTLYDAREQLNNSITQIHTLKRENIELVSTLEACKREITLLKETATTANDTLTKYQVTTEEVLSQKTKLTEECLNYKTQMERLSNQLVEQVKDDTDRAHIHLDLSEKYTQAEEQMRILREKYSQLQEKIKSIENECTAIHVSKEEITQNLQNKFEKQKIRTQVAQQECERQRSLANHLKEDINQIEQVLATREADVTRLHNKNEELNRLSQSLRSKMTADANSHKEVKKSLLIRLQTKETELSVAQKGMVNSETVKRYQSSLNTQQRKLENSEQERKVIQDELVSSQKEVVDLNNIIDELTKKLDKTTQTNEAINREKTDLQERLERRTEKMALMIKKLEETRKEAEEKTLYATQTILAEKEKHLQDTIAGIMSSIITFYPNIENIQKNLDMFESTCDAKLKSLDDRFFFITDQIKQSCKHLILVQNSETSREALMSRVDSTTMLVNNLNKALLEQRSVNVRVSSEKDVAFDKAQRALKELNRVSQQLHTTTEELHELREAVGDSTALISQMNTLQSEHTKVKKLYNELQCNISDLQIERDELQKQVDNNEELQTKLEASMATAKRASGLEIALAATVKRLNEVTEKIKQDKQIYEKQTEEVRVAHSAEIEAMERKLYEKSTQNERLQASVDTRAHQLTLAKEIEEESKSVIDDLKGAMLEVDKTINEKNIEIEKLHKKEEELLFRLDDLSGITDTLNKKNDALENMKKIVKEHKHTISELRTSLYENENEMKDTKAELKKQKLELMQLETALESAQASIGSREVAPVARHLTEKIRELEEKRRELRNSKNQIIQLQDDLITQKQTTAELRRQLAIVNKGEVFSSTDKVSLPTQNKGSKLEENGKEHTLWLEEKEAFILLKKELQHQLSTALDQIANLESQLSIEKAKYDAFSSTTNKSSDIVTSLQDKQTLLSQRDSLNDELSKIKDTNKSLVYELGTLKKENHALGERLQEGTAIITTLTKEKEMIKGQNKSLQDRLVDMEDNLVDEKSENEALREQLTTEKGENEALREQLTTEKGENEGLREQLTTEKGENEALREQLTTEKSENEALREQLIIEKKENIVNDLKSNLSKVQKERLEEKEALLEDNNFLKNELVHAQQRIEELSNERSVTHGDKDALAIQFHSLKDNLSTTQHQLAMAKDQWEALKKKLDISNEENKKLNHRLEEINEENKTLNHRLEETYQKNISLENQIKDGIEEQQQLLEKTNSNWKDLLANADSRNEDLSLKLSSAKEEVNTLINDNEELSFKLSSTQEEVNTLTLHKCLQETQILKERVEELEGEENNQMLSQTKYNIGEESSSAIFSSLAIKQASTAVLEAQQQMEDERRAIEEATQRFVESDKQQEQLEYNISCLIKEQKKLEYKISSLTEEVLIKTERISNLKNQLTLMEATTSIKQQHTVVDDDEQHSLRKSLDQLQIEHTKVLKKLKKSEFELKKMSTLIEEEKEQRDEENCQHQQEYKKVEKEYQLLEEANKGLKRKKEEYTSHIEELEREVGECTSRIKSLESDNTAMEGHLASVSQKQDIDAKLNEELHAKLLVVEEQATHQLKESNNSISNLHTQLDDANDSISNLHTQLEDANTQLEESNDFIANLHTQLDDANAQLEESNNSISNLHTQLDDANEAILSAQNTSNKDKQSLQEHMQYYNELENAYNTLKMKLEEVNTQNIKTQVQLETSVTEYNKLQLQCDNFDAQVQSLLVKNGDADSWIEELQYEMKSDRIQIAELKQELKNTNERLVTLNKEKLILEKEIDVLIDTAETEQKQIEVIMNTTLQSMVEDRDNALERVAAIQIKYEENIKHTKTITNMLKEEITGVSMERNSLEEQKSILESRNTSLEEKLNYVEMQTNTLHSKVNSLEAQKQTLVAQSNIIEEKLAKLMEENLSITTEKASLLAQKDLLIAKVASKKRQNKENLDKIINLKNRLLQMEEDRKVLVDAVESVNNSMTNLLSVQNKGIEKLKQSLSQLVGWMSSESNNDRIVHVMKDVTVLMEYCSSKQYNDDSTTIPPPGYSCNLIQQIYSFAKRLQHTCTLVDSTLQVSRCLCDITKEENSSMVIRESEHTSLNLLIDADSYIEEALQFFGENEDDTFNEELEKEFTIDKTTKEYRKELYEKSVSILVDSIIEDNLLLNV